MTNQCPFCMAKPPAEVWSWQRRRWQAAHIATQHVKEKSIMEVG